MDRSEWLKQMRLMTEALYDHISPLYWVRFGFYENQTHLDYLHKFLERVSPGSPLLSAACGAGRYDGYLLAAGHPVIGIDQSEGMLERARGHFPQIHYQKLGLQEMDFQAEFAGAICMDAFEHVCPEDWPAILQRFSQALKPGGLLYFTQEPPDVEEVETSYRRAIEMGLPVVYGELADQVQASYERVMAMETSGVTGEGSDVAVYHFYPTAEQVHNWLAQAGFSIEEEGLGSGYRHLLARKLL